MSRAAIPICALALLFACPLVASTKQVIPAEPPSWVAPGPSPTTTPTPDGAMYRIAYSDIQIHLGPDGMETFQAFRIKILKPEGLAAGNVSLTWSPDAGDAKIHYVRIIRDAEVIDVLKLAEFQVLQREGFLEKSALNGQLTAVLQSPGLQVGDEIEVASTVRTKDPTLGDHLFGFAYLTQQALPGAFRIRILWPAGGKLKWRASSDVAGISVTTLRGQTELRYELRDPGPVTIAEGAPARFNTRRSVEFSDFDSWSDISRRMWPLFDQSSALSAESPIRKEISRIAASDNDPVKKIAAALKLVQDRIRYVYLGFNGGNLMPAGADQTWDRRFGDCKAKSALLLAILRELGFAAEAVLVNTVGGDGLNEHLPTPGAFDHVVVRVRLGGNTYWLDGSRIGDATLDQPLRYRWVLPVRSAGADLESMPVLKPRSPDTIVVVDVDASGGVDQKAPIKLQQLFRGDVALNARSQLMALSAEDADRFMKAFWRQTNQWVEPDRTSWRYDDQRSVLLLTLSGQVKLEWRGDDSDGRVLDIIGAGFNPPREFHRPKDQDQKVPWLTEYPAYRCWATAIHLPPDNSKWAWEYSADPMDLHLGGVHYWRATDLRDGVMRTVMSRRFEAPEITVAQAEEVNKKLPSFNNNVSFLYQRATDHEKPKRAPNPLPPFQGDTDWMSPAAPCGSPGN